MSYLTQLLPGRLTSQWMPRQAFYQTWATDMTILGPIYVLYSKCLVLEIVQ